MWSCWPPEPGRHVWVKLWAASDCPDTDFVARLIDVYPDGFAVNLTQGIVRASYREGYERPVLMNPGTPYEFTIELLSTSNLFKTGHRIRVLICSADYPNFDRNHNTGKPFWSDTELRVANQTIFHDETRSSRIVLPIIPAA